jgi:hypothetical protein
MSTVIRKGFVYNLTGNVSGKLYGYSNEVEATTDAKWADAKTGSFTDDDGNVVNCRAGKFWELARVKNGVCVGPQVAGTAADDDFGTIGPISREMPDTLGEPGQVLTVNDAGNATEWGDAAAGGGGLVEGEYSAEGIDGADDLEVPAGVTLLRITGNPTDNFGIKGIDISTVPGGRIIIVNKTDPNSGWYVNLLHQQGSSSAANRILNENAGNYYFPVDSARELVYSEDLQRWHIIGKPGV